MLVTRGDLIRNNPDLVQRMVTATRLGWKNYLQDPQLGNRSILAANQHGMTAEALDFGGEQLKMLAIPPGSDPEILGTMTPQRWETLVQQMEQIGLIKPGSVQANECFETRFLDAATSGDGSTSGDSAMTPAAEVPAE